MSIMPNELKKIAKLAHLDIDSHNTEQLTADVSAIMDYVESLRELDTTRVAPLQHPLDLPQTLRADEITETDCVAQLEALAPLFDDNLYLVPPVLDPTE